MKTKEELLKRYEGDPELLGMIQAHFGSKESFQNYDGSLLDFDEDSKKDVVGGEELSYADYIDVQIRTGKNYRGSFMLCYHNIPMGFKGEVKTFAKGKICFERIYVDGMYSDGICFTGKEDHVWMDVAGFEGLNKGDCVSFHAETYRYLKKGHGKLLDYGLRNPSCVKKIDRYELPTDDELLREELRLMICEACFLNETCSRIDCIRKPKEIKSLMRSMETFAKAGEKKEK